MYGVIRKSCQESSYLSRLAVDVWQSQKVCCELFSDVLEMEPDCERLHHRYYIRIPAEPLGVHELVSRGVSDPNCDGTTCRTYYTDVVSR